jgi:hypothetical protein
MEETVMLRMIRGLGLGFAATLALGAGISVAEEERQPVDLAICLDTSNSMDGLIDAARRKLWDITNELAKAKPTPRLRVALLSYGNTGYNAAEGWVRLDSPFTEDLDAIYQKLFALTTHGGEEYVGRVVRASIDRLEWSASPKALKLVFVAGNESADQDRQAPYRDVCRAAIGRGIQVNAIYCGASGDGDASGWREAASLADGKFASIDPSGRVVEIATPYDQALQALSASLNSTYIPVGARGGEGAANQVAQDANASSASAPAAAERAAAKGGKLYRCEWDLVDACRDKKVKLDEVKDEDLPAAMRTMTPEQRKAHVEEMGRKREAIQKEIAEVNAKRQAFIEEERKKQAPAATAGLDEAVKSAVREQAEAKGFAF